MADDHSLELIAIAAMAENRVIGSGGAIPWHLPEDFKFFKRTTMGHTLLMGRKTFDSIGRPLPGRKTVVLSRSGAPQIAKSFPEVLVLTDWRELAEKPVVNELPGDVGDENKRRVFVAGGAEIYRQLLPYCTELLLTRLRLQPEGDTFFPEFENRFSERDLLLETEEFAVSRWVNDDPLPITLGG